MGFRPVASRSGPNCWTDEWTDGAAELFLCLSAQNNFYSYYNQEMKRTPIRNDYFRRIRIIFIFTGFYSQYNWQLSKNRQNFDRKSRKLTYIHGDMLFFILKNTMLYLSTNSRYLYFTSYSTTLVWQLQLLVTDYSFFLPFLSREKKKYVYKFLVFNF